MQTERRLTSFSHGAGCGCKLGPEQLRTLMDSVTLPAMPPEVLVGADTGDDAAVYRLPSGEAIIATLDFFTPIVDDPYDWGRIAATNALSDVYAMGGRPIVALNIVNWPVDDLPLEMLSRVLQGGIDMAAADGVAVLGGHSITDPEPKYGMVVLGLAAEDDLTRNSTARAGDRLFLTKPLGLGIVSTAIKRGLADEELVHAAVDLMTTTNRAAAEAMRASEVSAATDVTGFGLLGHLQRMLEASGVAARLDAASVPLLDRRVLELARSDVVPGGSKRNLAHVRPLVDFDAATPPEQAILADAQTSGGLLIATERPGPLRAELRGEGIEAAEIGEVIEGPPGRISVLGRLPE